MRVRKVKQLPLAARLEPDGFGYVRDRVAAVGPRGEDAELSLALRTNRPVAEAGPRMTTAGIGKHQECPVRRLCRFDAEPLDRCGDLVGCETKRRAHLRRGESVCRHVLQPGLQLRIGLRRPDVGTVPTLLQ